jgi:regulator-associated protein of mTOR
MGGASGSEQRKNVELNLAVTLPVVTADGSPMVRKELIVALSRLVFSYEAACKEVRSLLACVVRVVRVVSWS